MIPECEWCGIDFSGFSEASKFQHMEMHVDEYQSRLNSVAKKLRAIHFSTPGRDTEMFCYTCRDYWPCATEEVIKEYEDQA